jgi:DNA-directed RNA polymerase specialized sigma24 family protein
MAMDRGRSLERKGARMRRLRVESAATRPAQNPERDYAAAQDADLTGRLFSEAMSQLEPRHLLVISLLYRDDLTLREAGRVMYLDFSTVSRRAKAARSALRSAMTALAEARWGMSEEAVSRMFVDGAAGASFQGLARGGE